MKKSLLTLVAAIAFTTVFAQNYEAAVKQNLDSLNAAKTSQAMQQCISMFERISNAEPSKWEAHYYWAYSEIIFNYWQQGNTDKQNALLDDAEKNLQKALEVKGDKSEIYTLQGFLCQARIGVTPAQAMVYSQKSSSLFQNALSENKQNPRAYYLLGMNKFYTPKAFGGGAQSALPFFETAKQKFEAAKNQTKSAIFPAWGEKENADMLEKCKSGNGK